MAIKLKDLLNEKFYIGGNFHQVESLIYKLIDTLSVGKSKLNPIFTASATDKIAKKAKIVLKEIETMIDTINIQRTKEGE